MYVFLLLLLHPLFLLLLFIVIVAITIIILNKIKQKSTNSFMHAYQEKRLYRNIEVRKSWITRNL